MAKKGKTQYIFVKIHENNHVKGESPIIFTASSIEDLNKQLKEKYGSA